MIPKEAILFEGCTSSRRLFMFRFCLRFLLDKFGIRWRLPPNPECCGSPVARSGGYRLAQKQRSKLISDVIRLGYEHLITACPGCGSWIKPEAEARGVEVIHIIQILYELAKAGKLYDPDQMRELRLRLTAHFPCHLDRGMKLDCSSMIPKILNQFPFFEYIPMEYSDRCCGAGGGVRASQPELAFDIASRKIEAAAQTGADLIVVASCPFCELHLHEASRRLGMGRGAIAIHSLIAFCYKDIEDALLKL